MEGIVVTEDELKHLERRFGPSVRCMGPWYSDGIFGYSSVPVIALHKAAKELDNPSLKAVLSRLGNTNELSNRFTELLETFGLTLIEKIVDTYRQCSLKLAGETHPPSKPPKRDTRAVSVAAAASTGTVKVL